MHYFSTNRGSPPASFKDAVLTGQPDDLGLFFPSAIPQIDEARLSEVMERSREQIAFDVIRPFVGGDVDDEALFDICSETVDFDFPLVQVTERIWALELFHGPTMAFKDVGARFMSRCLRYFSRGLGLKTIVVVATSGDTGGAVAAGFHGVEDVEVVIIYPHGMVSRVQELQLTTLGGNVTTLELHGTFDDCQALAKQALADPDLRQRARLTSANSINVARWLPQQFYYYYALKQWRGDTPPVISVPSGNFGNLASGVLANVSGLPVRRFIAACNANDAVPRFLSSHKYEPRPTVRTLSNAMDVGRPSNFVRILELLGNDPDILAEKLYGSTIVDEETTSTIRDVRELTGYVLDPHGAVAYRALDDYLSAEQGDKGIFLETAHPIKFDSVAEILGASVERPVAIEALEGKTKVSVEVDNNYAHVKEMILSKV
jgi:threonine synthase